MDLSKKAKTRRDAVEDPLWILENILDELDECQTRVSAATTVWSETERTLNPVIEKQDAMQKHLLELKKKLSALWNEGFAKKWKEL